MLNFQKVSSLAGMFIKVEKGSVARFKPQFHVSVSIVKRFCLKEFVVKGSVQKVPGGVGVRGSCSQRQWL